jgi:hypothetical protein
MPHDYAAIQAEAEDRAEQSARAFAAVVGATFWGPAIAEAYPMDEDSERP